MATCRTADSHDTHSLALHGSIFIFTRLSVPSLHSHGAAVSSFRRRRRHFSLRDHFGDNLFLLVFFWLPVCGMEALASPRSLAVTIFFPLARVRVRASARCACVRSALTHLARGPMVSMPNMSAFKSDENIRYYREQCIFCWT